MEYIEGPNLRDYINAQGQEKVSIEFVSFSATELFSALAYAHEKEILHCDFKPENIMLNLGGAGEAVQFPMPMIVDFGLAVIDGYDADDNPAAMGRMAGTRAYMAPEQFRGETLEIAVTFMLSGCCYGRC